MVIEASKAVQPRSLAIENAWAGRLPGLAISQFEERLNELGIETVWAYGFVAFFVLACVSTSLRRRFRMSFTVSTRKMRKPSVSGDAPLSPTHNRWLWPWQRNDETRYSVEDGTDVTPIKPLNRMTLSRLRLWSLRLGNLLKRNAPFGQHVHHSHHVEPRPTAMRHASMPLTHMSLAASPFAPGYLTQPPSPRINSSFFTPANPGLTTPSIRPTSTSPESRQNATASSFAVPSPPTPSTSSSPPRLKGMGRPSGRLNSNHLLFQSLSAMETKSPGGWNDPPMSAFSEATGDRLPTGMLTPTTGASLEHTLSRNSSRVNLSEMGLAQRSASRAATPHNFEDGTS